MSNSSDDEMEFMVMDEQSNKLSESALLAIAKKFSETQFSASV